MMKIKLIINPTAPKYRDVKTLEVLKGYFGRHNISTHIFMSEKPGDATRAAREGVEQGYDIVVACGGDGTLREVVSGISGSSVRLGIIPLGTGNIIAKELEIPLGLKKACSTIIEGKVENIDVGKSGENYFILAAGVGYDGETVWHMNPNVKSRVGRLAYVLAGLKVVLKYRPREYRVESDKFTGRVKALGIVVCNAAHYGAKFLQLKEDISINDGYFDVCIFTGKSGLDIFKIFFHVCAGLKIPQVNFISFKTKNLKVYSDRRVHVQNDGDLLGMLVLRPMEFNIIEKGLSVIVPKEKLNPAEKIKELFKNFPREVLPIRK